MTEDNVIYAEFGNEREWAKTRTKTIEGLVTIGKLYGDSEQLMKAKGEVVYHCLRAIVDDVPSVTVSARLPDYPPGRDPTTTENHPRRGTEGDRDCHDAFGQLPDGEGLRAMHQQTKGVKPPSMRDDGIDIFAAKSQMIVYNACKDPGYRPYCLRCVGNYRMEKVEPFLWQHRCGAIHDERQVLIKP
jgi:hypothetical protein